MTEETKNSKNYIHHSSLTSRALVKGFKKLDSGTIVAEISVMSGKDGDKQRYLNGSFVVSKSVSYFAETQLEVDYGKKGIVANVVISDLDVTASPNDKKPESPYINYRGFLNEITIG